MPVSQNSGCHKRANLIFLFYLVCSVIAKMIVFIAVRWLRFQIQIKSLLRLMSLPQKPSCWPTTAQEKTLDDDVDGTKY